MNLSEIPGYSRAEARGRRLEESLREWAFIAATEKLCGVHVHQLTLRMFVELCAVRSPFLCGGQIGGEDVVLFLWRLSVRFSRTDAELRARFVEFVRPIAFEEIPFRRAVRSIRRFVDRTLLDRPPASGGASSLPDVSFVASLVDEIATAYGWDEDCILDTPMPRLFQYLRRIQRNRNPELPRFNPITARLTKKVVARHVAKQQELACPPAKS